MDDPVLEVRWLSSEPLEGDWRVTWEVGNAGVDALRLDSAHAPHARFRGAERALGSELAPGARSRVELVVRLQPVDDAAPNPFLALRITFGGAPWLVLARLAI